MSFLKVKGVVTREVNTGEADRVITILTRNEGRITAFARNARRPKSKLAAGTQLLCLSEFVLFRGKDMYSLNSCDLIESFHKIRYDLVKLTYAAHIVDLINDIIQENQPASKTQQLLLQSLEALAEDTGQPAFIVRAFELRFLTILGYGPGISGCVSCGARAARNMHFSFKKCGFLCGSCLRDDEFATGITPEAAKAINYIGFAKIDDLFKINVSDETLKELEKLMRRYIRERLEKDYNKLDFLKELEPGQGDKHL